MVRLFVYGTLQRGGRNHHHLQGQRFLGPARTAGGWRLHDLGSYPAMVAAPDASGAVHGELWEVDSATLTAVDRLEGVPQGLFRRADLALASPPATHAEAYLYQLPTDGWPLLATGRWPG